MSTRRLTPRPSVPVLVRAAAFGALMVGPMGCGDDKGNDEGGNGETFDSAPTAGPCFHDGGDLPECQGTTGGPSTTSDSGPPETSFDDAPTAGPCYHDPELPECQSTGADGTSTGDTDGSGTSGTDTGTSGTGSG